MRCHLLELISFHLDAAGASVARQATAGTGTGTGVGADAVTLEHRSTLQQLSAFCAALRRSHWLDTALASAPPEQSMRHRHIALGPVAVLGAGPVSGAAAVYAAVSADVIAALAAGCPVLVLGNAIQAGCCALLARAVAAALRCAGLPDGIYALLQDAPGSRDALITHPDIKAATFSGSREQGLQLMRRSLERSEPIAVMLDLASSNPVFILPQALNARAEYLGQQLLKQLGRGMAHGIYKPGIVVAIEGDGYIDLRETIVEGLAALPGMAAPPAAAQSHVELEVDAATLLARPALLDEPPGPAGLLVLCASADQMLDVAALLDRQLVASLHMDDGDTALAARLMPQLERMARHVNVNSFRRMPMYNGATAAQAVSRFLRPVFYLDLPPGLLPAAPRDANPLQ